MSNATDNEFRRLGQLLHFCFYADTDDEAWLWQRITSLRGGLGMTPEQWSAWASRCPRWHFLKSAIADKERPSRFEASLGSFIEGRPSDQVDWDDYDPALLVGCLP
jgi:hypothetical protein